MRDISIILPVKDEAPNLAPLVAEIHAALAMTGLSYEVLLVDDGSRDGSAAIIRGLALADPRVRGLVLDRNHGQTAAFVAGFERALGRLFVTMDADGQNDPRDIPLLLEAVEGHDLAIGLRARRRDSLPKRLSSRVANAVRSWVTGDGVTDTGCSLKAFRPEVARAVPPFMGMHRFLPALARMDGFSVTQVVVSHRPRVAGRSKYGLWNRLLPGVWDLVAVHWMRHRRLHHEIVEEVVITDDAGVADGTRVFTE